MRRGRREGSLAVWVEGELIGTKKKKKKRQYVMRCERREGRLLEASVEGEPKKKRREAACDGKKRKSTRIGDKTNDIWF